ncbi:Pyruvate dehydrogenase E1 component subunit alpha, somatic form, mitochondrial [Bonamia ostreae]|uniref:Pyruvate dehydrogenase E1 component subunit alpha, somatic form, mitochondrial n=1 Tax=Bonamia ostreae TaxID=126728 RepID=A0ABV2AKW5_9EUKA
MFSKSVSLRRFGTSAMLKCSPTKAHKCLHPKSTIMVHKNELLQYFENMNLIRKMEIKTDSIYKSGLIRGFCHLYDGQEAVAVGIEAGIKPSDHLITAYRCHAQQLLRGDSVRGILAEMLGKKTGTSKGKGGSMHLYMPQNNFHGGNGIGI